MLGLSSSYCAHSRSPRGACHCPHKPCSLFLPQAVRSGDGRVVARHSRGLCSVEGRAGALPVALVACTASLGVPQGGD